MSEFTRRGGAFEAKFVHEEGLRFKAIARRNIATDGQERRGSDRRRRSRCLDGG
jgi:hypothetical protein